MTPAEEIIVAKKKLEDEISKRLWEFAKETGCFVVKITPERVYTGPTYEDTDNPLDRWCYGQIDIKIAGPSV